MGGGTPEPVQQPAAPPSSTETSAQAIQAQIDALPKILEAQKQYGGQFSEEQLKSLQTYGPQFAEAALKLQKDYGPQFAEIERSLSPELAGAQDTLKNFFAQTDQQEYESLKPGLLEDIRSAQSTRLGIGAISPLGSIDESVQLQRLKQSLKERRLNVALSTAGRVPISAMPTVQGQTGTGQLVQNVNPESIFNYQQSLNNFNSQIFGTQANMYGTQYNNMTARRGQNLDFAMKGAETAAGAAYLFCWVACEVFKGGRNNPKTSYARHFILNVGPRWFMDIYGQYGERFAKFIRNKNWIKNLIRPVFDVFAFVGSKNIQGVAL